MSRVFLDLAGSLDGFIAGPRGEDGGMHDWYFAERGAAKDSITAGHGDRTDRTVSFTEDERIHATALNAMLGPIIAANRAGGRYKLGGNL